MNTFYKMHGLGNDFMVLNAMNASFDWSSAYIQSLSDRRLGVGFDQLLVLTPADASKAHFHMRIFNADGSEVGQCGNGARCMALFIREQGLTTAKTIRLSTLTEVLELTIEDEDRVRVRMAIPKFEPKDIPFVAHSANDRYELSVANHNVVFSVVNVGNPHAVLVMDSLDAADVETLGPLLSKHELFPQQVNVGFMQVVDPQHVRLRVYERGTGETLACGSGACAAMVVARRLGLCQERVWVSQPGGILQIDWPGPGNVVEMSGPGAFVYKGSLF